MPQFRWTKNATNRRNNRFLFRFVPHYLCTGMIKIKLIPSAAITALLFSTLLVSCSDADSVPFGNPEDLSEEAKSFFSMRNGAAKSMGAAGTSAINKSFQSTIESIGGSGVLTFGKLEDSTLVSSPIPWSTCAKITQSDNPDGSTTYSTDYGTGCKEGYGDYTYLMCGKFVYTWKYTESRSGSEIKTSYFSKNRSDGYGGEYYYEGDTIRWKTNGRSTYNGESKYDTARQTFSGKYAYSDTSDYTYNGIEYRYKSIGTSSYDEKKSITLTNIYEYQTLKEFYKSTVVKPLVSDYSCYGPVTIAKAEASMWPNYVSGKEIIEYDKNGKSGKFEIDYGNGECDAIVIIYENGSAYKIDLSKDYTLFTRG